MLRPGYLLAVLAILASLPGAPAAVAADMAGGGARGGISFTAPSIKSGMAVRLDGRRLVIAPGNCYVGDTPVTVSGEVVITVPACPMVPVRDEALVLSTGPLAGQVSGTILSKCHASTADLAAVDQVLVPGSVRVKPAPGNCAPYRPGSDYVVDNTWGALAALPGGRIKDRQKVYADYTYFTRRLDTLVIDEGGNLSLLTGTPARTAPVYPALAARQLALANILAEPGNEPLAAADFLPVYSSEPHLPPAAVRKANREALSGTLAKLAAGGKLTIGFWGDSITAGSDASASALGFAPTLVSKLCRRYPSATISSFNCGIGGSSTKTRLAAFDREVLARKPDLIVIEFVNDVHLNKTELESNYRTIKDKVQAAGAEVILINPHLPSPRLMGVPTWKGVTRTPYYDFVRSFVGPSKWALADLEARWEHLDREGLTPEVLLVDKLIHINDLGHAMFADEIFKCFL